MASERDPIPCPVCREVIIGPLSAAVHLSDMHGLSMYGALARLTRELEEARACCKWEEGNQRAALRHLDTEHGTRLAEEFPFGCDTIEHVAEALIEARREMEAEKDCHRAYKRAFTDRSRYVGELRRELEEARERERRLREAHERSVGVFRRACEIAEAAILAGETPETASARLRNAIESDIAEINALVALASPQEAGEQ